MLLAIRNLSSREVEEIWPWLAVGPREIDLLEPEFKNKREREEWRTSPTTEHCFFSGVEGVNAGVRVGSENEAYRLRALVVDYDIALDDGHYAATLEALADESAPHAICRTSAGGARAIWLLEEPCFTYSKEVFSLLALELSKAVGAGKLLPGLDEVVLKNAKQYYEAGREWQLLTTADGQPLGILGRKTVMTILDKVLRKSSRKLATGINLPLDLVFEEVTRRWPGRWQGAFEDGARGVRFWDPDADALSAIIRPQGVVCYTGEKPFMSWAEILGHKFINQLIEDRIGGAILDTYFDGKMYWKKMVNGSWAGLKPDDLRLHLKVCSGLSGMVEKGSVSSEIDRALVTVQQSGWIRGAAPFIYMPTGICEIDGKRHLNIAECEVVAPATVDETVEWGQNFPWLADFLENLLDGDGKQDHYFMAWLARFYRGGYTHKPNSGQVVFLAGDANQGKTFLSNRVISRLMGGHVDASKFLLGNTDFNSQLFQSALWTIDDVLPASDPRRKTMYSAILKKMAANRTFEYHPKFQQPVMVPWSGRIMITCNCDAESVQILPDLDITIEDKVSVFRAQTHNRQNFMDGGEKLAAVIDNELPWFAAWLLQYEPPDEVVGNARYGVKAYQESELRADADASSQTNHFEELLDVYLEGWKAMNNGGETWRGRSTDLHLGMVNDEAISRLMTSITPMRLGQLLSKLVAKGKITKRRLKGRVEYQIPTCTELHPEDKNGAHM